MEGKIHYVSVTGIIRKDDKFLICKRSPNEKAFPNKWCVPGGKIEKSDFIHLPKEKDTYWMDIFERTLIKEIKEETNLDIKNIGYVSNLAFIRPNGFPTIIVSLFADYAGGTLKLDENELVDYAWVTLDELNEFDLLDTLYEQIEKVSKLDSKS